MSLLAAYDAARARRETTELEDQLADRLRKWREVFDTEEPETVLAQLEEHSRNLDVAIEHGRRLAGAPDQAVVVFTGETITLGPEHAMVLHADGRLTRGR